MALPSGKPVTVSSLESTLSRPLDATPASFVARMEKARCGRPRATFASNRWSDVEASQVAAAEAGEAVTERIARESAERATWVFMGFVGSIAEGGRRK